MYGLEQKNNQKFLFIHIPKTAGSTIHHSILRRPPNLTSVHWTYLKYEKHFGQDVLDKYWKFSFIRNPVSRFLSRIRYLKSKYLKDQSQHFDEREFVLNLGNPQNIADALVKNPDHWFLKKEHGISQYDFLKNSNGDLLMDFVGINEFFGKDIQIVMTYLGLGFFDEKKCKNFNFTGHDHSELLENQEFIEKINKIYPKDLDIYNNFLKLRGHV